MGKIIASQNIFGLTPKQILDNIWLSNFFPIDILPHCHTADKNTDWLYLIHDGRLLFHKNDYSDEFIDTNYYKQNKRLWTICDKRPLLQSIRTIPPS